MTGAFGVRRERTYTSTPNFPKREKGLRVGLRKRGIPISSRGRREGKRRTARERFLQQEYVPTAKGFPAYKVKSYIRGGQRFRPGGPCQRPKTVAGKSKDEPAKTGEMIKT